MIEINLSPTFKGERSELQRILSLLNIKWLLISVLISFVPQGIYETIIESDIQEKKNTEIALSQAINGLTTKMNELKKMEDEVAALKELELNLGSRIDVVRKVIEKKQNPFSVLLYIAENIPEDVWITEITISDGNLEVLGFSQSWKSIGKLIDNLKNSIFFSKSISYEQPKEKIQLYPLWTRMEIFQIKAKIIKYE
jgi:Tfp pilus assembly protein PilN